MLGDEEKERGGGGGRGRGNHRVGESTTPGQLGGVPGRGPGRYRLQSVVLRPAWGEVLPLAGPNSDTV